MKYKKKTGMFFARIKSTDKETGEMKVYSAPIIESEYFRFRGREFFVHQADGGYVVSCALTGVRITRKGKAPLSTIGVAVVSAKMTLIRNWKQYFEDSARFIQVYGVTPKYEEV